MGGGGPLYDVPAKGYDELYGEEQVRKYAAALGELPQLFKKPLIVLDIGCATGLLVNSLEVLGLDNLYIGIDLDADRLRVAKNRSPSAIVVQADAHALPIRSGVADLTACFTVIHLLDPEQAVREMVRVSRGTMIITLLEKRIDLKPLMLRLFREHLKGWRLKLLQAAGDVKDEVYILVKRDEGEASGQQPLGRPRE
jgi:ubiquinone/menaquinone biosynthesis C-methylase UbiE